MKIKEIGFVFENCEVLNLAAKDIIYLSTSGIERRYTGARGAFDVREYLSNVFVAVHKDAVALPNSTLFDEDELVRMRTDVTSLILTFEDDTTSSYILDWNDNGNNIWYCDDQRVSTTSDGHQTFIHSADTYLDSLISRIDFFALY